MSNMVISIVIPTRNRALQLKNSLDALLQDEYPHKEIIVCDGSSTDSTVDLLKSYGDKVRWISEPDKGEYEARNKGMRLATGEIIKYMSDDDMHLPGSLVYAARYLADHPDVDILFGQSIWFDARLGREPVICDTRKRTLDSITHRNFIRKNRPLVNSETAFFRRRVIERIGWFDEASISDYEYWTRAIKAGLKLDICDRVFIHYYLSDLSGVSRKHNELLLGSWDLARRYGDWTDQLYVALFMIPLRWFSHFVITTLPFIGVPLRNTWSRWKTRHHAS